MRGNANLDGVSLSEMGQEFVSLLTRLSNVFEGEPFRLPRTKRASRPLYDAMMIALSQSPDLEVERYDDRIRVRLDESLSNRDTYDILVGRGNTMESIRERVNVAEYILRG
jgi:hypothetical protein